MTESEGAAPRLGLRSNRRQFSLLILVQPWPCDTRWQNER
jgi:hypothetical protein